jgi:hypothetical protein
MQTINNNVYPKGGYVFTDSDGTRHPADSWPGVIARVRRYRERAGHPVGDVAAEVITQACQSNPGLCRQEDPTYAAMLNKATLKTRVLKWLSSLRDLRASQPPVFVSDDERKQRAATCATCPANQPLPSGCSSCLKALTELRKSVIGTRLIDGRLNACSVLGEDLPTSVHLEQTRVTNGELPAHCWRKSTF